ncbi:MAG: TIGR00266 family protein [Eubacteriales bacterium]|nr:TIGR00266 family protein [Sarcina sp.]MBR2728653.1 TIGR00266 family protein [Lachnospiraceae bacterium]MDO4417948.1 TIGR00266 family protein [Eubacteriales bacterium]
MNYKIVGEPMPAVICELENGEAMICESGAMSWMSPNMQMETTGGGAGKVFGRMFSGENLFQNRYTARNGQGMIAFASSFPGSIRAYEITPSTPIVVQKRAFLASTAGVDLSVHFQKKIGAGFFGGEGFIMQKISGSGTAFIEIDGSAVEYTLEAGQQMLIDTGYLAMMDATVQLDIQQVKGVKNMLLGGESLFNTLVTGPGRIVLQTMPITSFASSIASLLPSKS